jgi:hypothetical protein
VGGTGGASSSSNGASADEGEPLLDACFNARISCADLGFWAGAKDCLDCTRNQDCSNASARCTVECEDSPPR